MVENNKTLDDRLKTQDQQPINHVAWVDLDDTLWDFKANSHIALNGLYEAYALNRFYPTSDDWIKTYERHNHHLWDLYNRAIITKDYLMQQRFRRPLVETGVPEAHELGDRFDYEYLDRLAECTQLLDGAIELLTTLRQQGWKTGILSNGFHEVQHRKIRNSGLSPYIDYVVLSDDIGVNKPDVRLYRHAEEVAGARPENCLMIGDNPDTDIAGAINAGWEAFYFSPSGNTCSPSVKSFSTLHDITIHCLNRQ